MDAALLQALGSGSLAAVLAAWCWILWGRLGTLQGEAKEAIKASQEREDSIRADHAKALEVKDEKHEETLQDLLRTLRGIEHP